MRRNALLLLLLLTALGCHRPIQFDPTRITSTTGGDRSVRARCEIHDRAPTGGDYTTVILPDVNHARRFQTSVMYLECFCAGETVDEESMERATSTIRSVTNKDIRGIDRIHGSWVTTDRPLLWEQIVRWKSMDEYWPLGRREDKDSEVIRNRDGTHSQSAGISKAGEIVITIVGTDGEAGLLPYQFADDYAGPMAEYAIYPRSPRVADPNDVDPLVYNKAQYDLLVQTGIRMMQENDPVGAARAFIRADKVKRVLDWKQQDIYTGETDAHVDIWNTNSPRTHLRKLHPHPWDPPPHP